MNKQNPASFSNRVKSPALAFLACGALALFAGCESGPDSHVVSAPPPSGPATTSSTVTTQTTNTPVYTQPGVVTTQTTTGANGQVYTTQTQGNPVVVGQPNVIVVTQAPPALQSEVVLAQPSPDYKWVPGYWKWTDNRYVWISGHWELPPRGDSVWVAPRWEPENGGYRVYDGYWN
jgi:hypothetical protein